MTEHTNCLTPTHTGWAAARPKAGKTLWLLCLALLSACAGPSSKQAQADTSLQSAYAPSMQRALQSLDAFSKAQLGVTSNAPEIRFTNSKITAQTAPADSKAEYIVVPRSMGAMTRADLLFAKPIRLRSYELQELLSGAGNWQKTPRWLRVGSADVLAYTLIDGLDLPVGSHQQEAAYEVALRGEAAFNIAKLWSETDSETESDKLFWAKAYLVVKHLQALKGEQFWPAYRQYFSAPAKPGFSSAQAFEQAFGLSLADFKASAEARLETLHKEIRTHNRAIPEARAQSTSAFPLADKEARDAYARYLKENAPKAFAISSRGSWAYRNDQADAMDEALQYCRIFDALNCQLYAVDERIVYQAPVPGTGSISVKLADDDGDTWTEIVKKSWLPIVHTSATLFSEVLRDDLKVGLAETIHISVATSQAQYQEVLRSKFGQDSNTASRTGEFSGGIANQRGQIALLLRWTHSETGLRDTSVKTTLHELVHELQGQLSQGGGSFDPPRWMDEGIADLVSEGLAQKVAVNGSYHYSLEAWLEHCQDWYRKLGHKVDAQTLSNLPSSQWLELVRERQGPYEMASLMTFHLKNLLGEKFNPAWIKYYRLAGTPGTAANTAFVDSFGMSEEAYIASLQTWLNKL